VIKQADVKYTWRELGKNVWAFADGFQTARCFRGDRILSSLDLEREQVTIA